VYKRDYTFTFRLSGHSGVVAKRFNVSYKFFLPSDSHTFLAGFLGTKRHNGGLKCVLSTVAGRHSFFRAVGSWSWTVSVDVLGSGMVNGKSGRYS